ncbi:MAG: nucleotidyltransferase family protein [Chloroflexi bacterium]|nr:nucleotidyltransferase family protein [Chloroflexota bacterium]
MSTQNSVSKEVILERFSLGPEQIESFCRKHHIDRLALFGSVLRDDFTPDSDIDVLVEFNPDHIPGLITLAGMEMELSELIGGHKADLKTPLSISPYFREEVLKEAQALYVA